MEILTPEQAVEAAKGLIFENVWAALMENRIQMAKTQNQMAETKKNMDESQIRIEKNLADFKKSVVESKKTNEKIIKDLSKNIGGLGNSLGLLTESLFSAKLWKKFNKLGYPFTKQGPFLKFIENDKVIAEVDYFLENGDYAMPVEVKTILNNEHIDDHIERIAIIRRYMDARNDKRKLVGAVAGGVIQENVIKYAHKKGLYVIVQTGETVKIADTPDDFTAREW
jgi:hypothetical protein